MSTQYFTHYVFKLFLMYFCLNIWSPNIIKTTHHYFESNMSGNISFKCCENVNVSRYAVYDVSRCVVYSILRLCTSLDLFTMLSC